VAPQPLPPDQIKLPSTSIGISEAVADHLLAPGLRRVSRGGPRHALVARLLAAVEVAPADDARFQLKRARP